MLAQALPLGVLGIDVRSPATWFVVAVACVVLALTMSTRRSAAGPRSVVAAPVPALPVAAQRGYAEEWAAAQALFVKNPRAGFERARAIVANALCDRADVDGAPDPLGERYAVACSIAARGDATTEELRQAFVGFAGILDRLLAVDSIEAISNHSVH